METIYIVDKEGTITMQRGKQPLVCPFIQPVPQKNKYSGAIDFAFRPCNSNCPHFELDEENSSIFLSCGSNMRSIKVQPEKTESKNSLLIN